MPSRLSTARTAIVYSYVRSSPITPTLCTGNNTANDCHTLRYSPARRISSATIASARCSKSSFGREIGPSSRTASPGPGKGCRHTNSSSSPSVVPTARTSSLNNSRNGSTKANFMRSGSPPTLWWLLMTADGPRTDTLSITSGYNVPCARNATSPSARACSSNTSMNAAPMIFRFCSGSDTPSRRVRNRSTASANTRFNPRRWNRSRTCAASLSRNSPLSTKMQVSRGPIAL